MHSRSEFRLSTATPDDVGVLLSLIKELAAYERMSEAVVATEADIHRSLFSESPAASCFPDWDFRNSRIAFPSDPPTSGRRPTPKMIITMTSTIISSVGPTLNGMAHLSSECPRRQ